MAIFWDMANKSRRRAEDPFKAANPVSRKSMIEGAAVVKAGNYERVNKSRGGTKRQRTGDHLKLT
jgi:hypothetical protein